MPLTTREKIPMPNTEKDEGARYLIDLAPYAIPGQESISDVRLACALMSGKNDNMDLLTTSDGWTLRLCGRLICRVVEKDQSVTEYLGGSSVPPPDVIAAIESGQGDDLTNILIEENPYFEWIDAESVHFFVCEQNSIQLDPQKEIERLLAYIQNQDINICP
ncbi:MAG: hypothetical protein M0Z85_07610 [Gammaproteobacteria bacterium]|nr:hypothetical protein [Gammaproteobacteria bacterium]